MLVSVQVGHIELFGSCSWWVGLASKTAAQFTPESVDRNTPNRGDAALTGSSRNATEAKRTLGRTGETATLIRPGVVPGNKADPPMRSVQLGVALRAFEVR